MNSKNIIYKQVFPSGYQINPRIDIVKCNFSMLFMRLFRNESLLDPCCSEIWLPVFCGIWETITCWRSLPVFDAGILMVNPSPLTPCTLICRSSKPSASSSVFRWLDMAGKLKLAVGQTCTRNCAKQISASSLLSGKHSGAIGATCRTM